MDADPNDETQVIEMPPPIDPAHSVGAVPRPPRMVTIGRRRSDRALAYMLMVALVVFIGAVVYTSARLDQITDRLDNAPVCRVETR